MSPFKRPPTSDNLPKPAPFTWRAYALILTLIASLLATLAFIGYRDAPVTHSQIEQTSQPPGQMRMTNVSVLTYKNDTWRTGQNAQEILLTVHNVNTSSFGKRMTYPVDGRVYAQPLFVPHLRIHGAVHNVIFVATEHDSVYAFDADNVSDTRPLWQSSFIAPPDVVPESDNDAYCPNIGGPDIGITGTPVIDLQTKTLYVVAVTKEHGQFFSRLHALDITTGQERPHSPVTIMATVPGAGYSPPYHSVDGKISFTPQRENQRAALLLLHHIVYIAWGSHCDNPPYFGWLMGYDATTLHQMSVYASTPDQQGGGIWQSGAGLAADPEGNIYLETGEADFTLNMGGHDAGDAVLKLSTQHGLRVVDYFTPFNQYCLSKTNMDLGSAGPLLLPNAPEVIASSKEGRIYVLNRTHLGGYHTVAMPCSQTSRTDVDQVMQEFPPNTAAGGVWGSPAYWHGPSGDYLYVSGMLANTIKAYQLTNGLLSPTPSSQSSLVPGSNGSPVHVAGNPVVSCNGQKPGTGIVWLIDQHGLLRAYDAANLAHELYTSAQNPHRDALGDAVKFSVPTVANGEVFVGTTTSLLIYGLLHP